MKPNDAFCDCDVIHADVVNAVKLKMPSPGEVANLSVFFKLLGDGTRTRIIWALDESEMCVCDLAALLGMTKSAISHQLSLLRRENLVKNRKDGRVVYYSLADKHVQLVFEMGRDHIQEKAHAQSGE